jgi:hypothetical protein
MESAMKKGSSTESQGRTAIALFRLPLNASQQYSLNQKRVELLVQ